MSRVNWTEEKTAELIAMARAGDSWDDINTHFYPGGAPSKRAAGIRFLQFATEADKQARREALCRHGVCETRSPWAGMGNCFA